MSSLRAYESASECNADISAAAPGALVDMPIGAPLPLYSAVEEDDEDDGAPPPGGPIISVDEPIISGCVDAPDMPIIAPGPDSGSMPRGAWSNCCEVITDGELKHFVRSRHGRFIRFNNCFFFFFLYVVFFLFSCC
jgi:hypothetical protein